VNDNPKVDNQQLGVLNKITLRGQLATYGIVNRCLGGEEGY